MDECEGEVEEEVVEESEEGRNEGKRRKILTGNSGRKSTKRKETELSWTVLSPLAPLNLLVLISCSSCSPQVSSARALGNLLLGEENGPMILLVFNCLASRHLFRKVELETPMKFCSSNNPAMYFLFKALLQKSRSSSNFK